MTTDRPDHAIRDEADLRDHYRPAHQAVLDKARPKIDPKAAGFIAASPFMVLASTSASGTDASPRGGPPGFVTVLDEHHLAFGDLSGNNRLDSYANIVEHAHVGLLFLVPGVGETLRVNGRATLTTEPSVLAADHDRRRAPEGGDHRRRRSVLHSLRQSTSPQPVVGPRHLGVRRSPAVGRGGDCRSVSARRRSCSHRVWARGGLQDHVVAGRRAIRDRPASSARAITS